MLDKVAGANEVTECFRAVLSDEAIYRFLVPTTWKYGSDGYGNEPRALGHNSAEVDWTSFSDMFCL